MSDQEYTSWISSPFVDDHLSGGEGVSLVLVSGDLDSLPQPGSLPVVVAGVGQYLGAPGPCGVDLVVGPDDMADLMSTVSRNPGAATALVVMLRAIAHVDVDVALGMESAVYSLLQGGPEFRRWRQEQHRQRPADTGPTVLVERRDDELHIALHRPHRHNAISSRLRDELCDALRLGCADDSITRVTLVGDGPSFCSGGDLGEFGSFPDPVAAHQIRLSRSPARLAYRLRDRLHVHVHGRALGGGLELAAFATHVSAAPDTLMGLPEIPLGLIPGAGGTVSITRRVGRQRMAALALTARQIGPDTALEWGLIDEITHDIN